ncbi:MAG: heavy metal translocating P-type ATPase [Anaerocolumna sp.]
MEDKKEVRLTLEGLDCNNCAMKIEDKVSKLDGVYNAAVSFATKSLNYEVDVKREEDILQNVKKIVKQVEPDVVVRIKNISHRAPKNNSCTDNCCGHSHGANNHSANKPCECTNGHQHDAKGTNEHSHGAHTDNGDKYNDMGCQDGCCTGEAFEKTESFELKKDIIKFGISLGIFGVATIFKLPFQIEIFMYLISYLLSGADVLIKAFKNILKGDFFDENFLMSIATLGAFAVGEYPEGAAVMLFYQIGEMFQGFAVYRSRKSITDLMDIRPEYANVIENGVERKVSPNEVLIGHTLLVKPGEKVPLDGTVIDGFSAVDTSALTGESLPREVSVGDVVLGGFINKNGLLKIEVIRDFEDSTVAKILDLVENASSKKAPTENFITKFARKYTPAVTIAALIMAVVPPLVIPGATFSDWVYRALIFLVISCPCALVVSIPLGFFGGIGGASRHGVLVKGSNYLEALNDVDTIVFDKTGTLTKGIFKVTKVNPMIGYEEEELLRLAAYAESHSNHPIAISIVKAYEGVVDKNLIYDVTEIPGHGLKINYQGKVIAAGNDKLMEAENVEYQAQEALGTIVYVSVDGKYAGNIIISDEVKDDAKEALQGLKNMGIKKLVMLTGDSKAVGERIGKELGLDEVYAELLPDEKVSNLERIEKEKKAKGKLVFVGDGINDAPVLARADIGIAMGGLGSDAAIEAADVVLMTDEPSKIISAIKIAKKTHRIVWQNIGFALGIKAIVLLLGAFGVATMWEAVFADVGVALIAVLNAMRAMKVD